MFVMTKVLLPQNIFVTTKDVFCRDNFWQLPPVILRGFQTTPWHLSCMSAVPLFRLTTLCVKKGFDGGFQLFCAIVTYLIKYIYIHIKQQDLKHQQSNFFFCSCCYYFRLSKLKYVSDIQGWCGRHQYTLTPWLDAVSEKWVAVCCSVRPGPPVPEKHGRGVLPVETSRGGAGGRPEKSGHGENTASNQLVALVRTCCCGEPWR